ncbi:ABC transporter permease [Zoogloea sp.]|uniref:ABC transporter permease n=1 Tax=Zoogloea sp. TaxID=49181 RepID=UPI002636A948|nr:ABC transporter permease [uncultured Zoogloea sp.]
MTTSFPLSLPGSQAAVQAGRRLGGLGLALLLPAAILYLWQLAATREWVTPLLLPAPAVVLQALIDLHAGGELWEHLGISLGRVGWGYLAGVVLGLLLGAAMGLSKTVEAYLMPSFKAVSLVPVLGWLPLFIMLIGIEESLKVLIIAKAVIVPVTINTVKGIRNIAPGHFEVARIYRFSPLQTLGRLIVPSALPSLATGLRLGLANAWMALVAVELLAASEGVGFLMVHSRQLFQLDMVMASMVVIGVTGWVLDRALQSVEQRLLAWRVTAY